MIPNFVSELPGQPTRMLVVDDEPAIRFALSEYFRGRGMNVETTSNRCEAESLLENSTFDILVADLKLTGSGCDEGLDVVECACRTQKNCHVIVLSAYGTRATRVKAGARGADAFVDKPIRLEDLAKIIYDLLTETR